MANATQSSSHRLMAQPSGTAMSIHESANGRTAYVGTHVSMRVVQLNCHRSYSTSIAINDHQSEVMLLTEPYVSKQGKSPFDKNKWYAHSVGNHPRALIIAKKSVNIWPVSSLSSADCSVVAVELEWGLNKSKRTAYLASVYADILIDPINSYEKVIQYCNLHRYHYSLAQTPMPTRPCGAGRRTPGGRPWRSTS
jgi:hypothetical protein